LVWPKYNSTFVEVAALEASIEYVPSAAEGIEQLSLVNFNSYGYANSFQITGSEKPDHLPNVPFL
jgi:hypothetical protein